MDELSKKIESKKFYESLIKPEEIKTHRDTIEKQATELIIGIIERDQQAASKARGLSRTGR